MIAQTSFPFLLQISISCSCACKTNQINSISHNSVIGLTSSTLTVPKAASLAETGKVATVPDDLKLITHHSDLQDSYQTIHSPSCEPVSEPVQENKHAIEDFPLGRFMRFLKHLKIKKYKK